MRIHAVINAVRLHTALKHLRPKKTIKIFLYALGFATGISQSGIAAQTLTLMQGSEEKNCTASHSYPDACHHAKHESNPSAIIGRSTPLPLNY